MSYRTLEVDFECRLESDGERFQDGLMPIPAFDADGLLPEGIHACSLQEVRARFGGFQETDRRPRLMGQLEVYWSDAQASDLTSTSLLYTRN